MSGRRLWPMAVVFLAGALCGAGLALFSAMHALRYAIRHPEVRARIAADRLSWKLDLDAEQKGKIEAILLSQAQDLSRARLSRMKKTDGEIKALLNPEQNKRWENTEERIYRRWIEASAHEQK